MVKNDDELKYYTLEEGNPDTITELYKKEELPITGINVNHHERKLKRTCIHPLQSNISDRVVKSVKDNTSPIKNSSVFENADKKPSKILIAFDTTNKKLFYVLPLKKGKRMYTNTKFPDPIHIYFSQSIEQYSESERLKEHFPLAVQATIKGENIDYITDDTYHKYFKNRIGSIIMLKMSINSFINHFLPDEANENLPFIEKLDIINSTSKKVGFDKKDKKMRDSLQKIDDISNRLSNMPTKEKKKNIPAAMQIFEEVFNLDLLKLIKMSKNFMNLLRPNYIHDYKKKNTNA